MSREEYLDESALERLYKLGGGKLVNQMIDIFLTNASKRLGEARNGEEMGDFKVIEQAVHSLKSSAGNVGAEKLRELAGVIEELAEKEQGERISALLDELEAAFEQVKVPLEKEKKGLET